MRTYEESCALLDLIVGRCVRDSAFAESVLAQPEVALAEYELNQGELDDFLALKAGHREEAAETWAAIRSGVDQVRARQQHAQQQR